MTANTEGCHTEEPGHKGEEDSTNQSMAKWKKVNPPEMIKSHLIQSQRNRKRKMTSKAIT